MTRFTNRTLVALMLSLLVWAALTPAAEGRKKPWEKIKLPPLGEIQMPEYERVELDNGMIMYLAEDHAFPLVELSATIRAGSIFEPPEKAGLASITGTVLRSGGAGDLTGDAVDSLVEAMGMQLETSIDRFSGNAFLSALKEDADAGLALLADILMRPRFEPERIDIAKSAENAAISRRNDDPFTIARREARRLAFGADHPLARIPEYDTINSITRDDLLAFHQRYFHPNYTYLVVIGDFDRSEMVDKVERAFAGWESTSQPPPSDPEIPRLPRRVRIAPKEDLTQTTLIISHLGIRADDPNYAAIRVASRILGEGFGSRLFNEVRSKRGYAYAVGSGPGTGFRFPGVFTAFCQTKNTSTQAAAELIIEEIAKMTTEPITEEELEGAKTSILDSEAFDYDTKREILDRLVMYELNGYPADFLTRYQEQVREMTVEKVLAAVEAVWKPDQLSILAIGNSAEFDGDLSLFGPVEEIDISIPEPTMTIEIPAATDASLREGQMLMARAADAMGRRALTSAQSFRKSMAMEAKVQGMNLNIEIEETVVYPDRMHMKQKLPFGEMTQVLAGDAGWVVSPMGSQDMTAEQVADARDEIESDLISVLRDPSTLQCQALEPTEIDGTSCSVVYITGAGEDYIMLFLDEETGLPYQIQSPGKAPMTGAPVTQKVRYDGYTTMSGLQVAGSLTILHDDEVFATGTIQSFEINPAIDEGIFQK